MEKHDPVPDEVTVALAEAYAALLELAELSAANTPACVNILNSLTTLDLHNAPDGVARAPYPTLGEYFQYSLDELEQGGRMAPEQRAHNQKMLAYFRAGVHAFIDRSQGK